jgi:hypothetical protein
LFGPFASVCSSDGRGGGGGGGSGSPNSLVAAYVNDESELKEKVGTRSGDAELLRLLVAAIPA